MYQPHNIFAFEDRLELLVFIAEGSFSLAAFSDFVDKASFSCIPDKVSLFYPASQISADDRKEMGSYVKARFQCVPSFFPFDERGSFGHFEQQAATFLAKATQEILKLRNPILLPPPGKSFTKPSGARESFFVQASNLFVRHAEMALLALQLIRKWGRVFDESITTIYVDTIDLYGLVSLACRMRFKDKAHAPITVSFSSYTGYKEVLAHADVSSSLMLISATTTHKLFREILDQTRWKAIDRVVTLLAIDPAVWASKPKVPDALVLAHIPPPKIQPHYALLPSVRLAGEKFTVEVDEPKAVVVNAGAHAECLRHIQLGSLAEMEGVLRGYGKRGSRRVPLFVDTQKLFENDRFSSWLNDEIEKHAPISSTHIVFVGSVAAYVEPLARLFGSNVICLGSDALRSPALEIKGSVIVICPTFTSGTKLLEISRDLRKQKALKSVVYITGLGTPESVNTFQRLKRNLEHGEYIVRSFCNVCTGVPGSLGLSWETELELLRGDEDFSSAKLMRERAVALENGMLTDENLFYKTAELEFHEGFKLWDGRIDRYPKTQPALLLFATFAFLLQNARVDPSLPESDKLTPLPNRRVVLSPENFFRFNDSLIQVAIMRSAFPGELDFADQEQHSASMLYLLERAEQMRSSAFVYEFLLAVTTRRLSLTGKANERISKLVSGSKLTECRWFNKNKAFRDVIKS